MKLKKLALALLLVVFSTSLFPKSTKALESIDIWESKYTDNTRKVWKINFNTALSNNIDNNKIKDYIYLEDYYKNRLSINVVISQDRKSAEIYYPYYGYEKNKIYYINILPGLESSKGKKLNKGVKIPFTVNDFIVFKDKNLESEVRRIINKPNGGILKEDVANVQALYLSNKDIESLEGLNYFVNLKSLNISNNKIKDITPIKSLNNLERIYMENNLVEDITSLKSLYNLKELYFKGNNIQNIDCLNYLYNLNSLDLGSNKISKISSLSNLTKLTYLKLDDNYVEDISPLKNLINLKTLYLNRNKITNYSSVVNYYDKVTYKDFTLNYPVSITDANLQQILRKKINKFNGDLYYQDLCNIKELDLSNTSIYNLSGIKYLEALEKLDLSKIKATDFSELQYLKNLKELNISNTTSYNKSFFSNLTELKDLNLSYANMYNSDLSYLAKLDKLLELNLKGNNSLTSILSLDGKISSLLYLNISETGIKYENSGEAKTLQDIINSFPNLKEVDTMNLKLDKEIILNGKVTFEDKNFEDAIREILKKYSGDIYVKDVKSIEKLDLQDMKIINLKGIESFKGLKYLDLSDNEIINIEPVSYLSNLQNLILHNNNISITGNRVFSNLKSLIKLDLSNNNISDISPLKAMVNLKRLDLSYNGVQNIYDLAYLKELEYLSLYHNEVGHDRFIVGQPIPAADLTPLEYLFNLKELFLVENDYIQGYPEETYPCLISYYENLQNKDFDIDADKCEVKFGKDEGHSEERSGLEKKVREILNKHNEEIITYGDVKNISSLDLSCTNATDPKVKELEGIQYFVNLTSLNLSNNDVSNTKPLMNLKRLEKLNLSNSGVDNEELKSLSGLVKLNELRIDGNSDITDIKPLENLKSITTLYLPLNSAMDLSPIAKYYYNVTNKNFTFNSGNLVTVERIDDIFDNVVKGDSFKLPASLSAKMTNGSMRQLEVIWDNYKVDTETPGLYIYYGTVEGYSRKVKLTLNVMNYKVSFRGNTTGNIMNKGLAASDGKFIYYSNLSNGGKLYKESLASGQIEQLTSDEVSYINVYNGWVYFLSKGDMYRIKTDGSNLTKVTTDNANYINLVDGYLYYFDVTKGGVWKINIDNIGTNGVPQDKIVPVKGSNTSKSWDVFTQIAVDNDYVYFQNLSDSLSLYKMKVNGEEADFRINSGEVRYINIEGDYLYFTEGERIYKIKNDGTEKSKVTSKLGTYINVSDGWIYFRNNSDEGKLYKVRTNGNELTKLSDDKVRNINVVENYIYYSNENDEFNLFKITK